MTVLRRITFEIDSFAGCRHNHVTSGFGMDARSFGDCLTSAPDDGLRRMTFNTKKKAIAFATSAAQEYRDLLHRYLRRRLRRMEDLDDLAQEVYVRLLRIQDDNQITRIREPMAYLHSIAANVLADWHRGADRCSQHGVSLDAVQRELDELTIARNDDPVECIARQQHVSRVFSKLPPYQRAVLLMHERDGMSYVEIATKLELSVGMVHYYLTKAKARVRLTPWDR